MYCKKIKVLASALLVVTIGLLFFCERNNPYDPNSKSFIPGKKPHVAFVNKAMSAFLLDTISIPVVWYDTAVGGGKGAIKTWYIDWRGDTLFNDTVAGNSADTMVFKRTFPAGEVTVRIRALDYDGNTSDADSMKLSVHSSRPKIAISGGSRTILKASACTLSVSASDTGGLIQTFFWAKNGADFNDSTGMGSFLVSFSDTGAKIVLVKARDNKGVETGVDTFRIAVYDKRGGVFYDGNGNTGGTVPTDTNTYVPGQSVIVLGNTGNLLKSGYVFSGWNTIPNGSGANYSAGAMFSMDTASAVLYAQWTANPKFGVVYNGNGSTGGVAPADTANYSIGQSVTVLGNAGSLVKTGNNFVGWNTEANGSGIGYAAGVSFVMGAAGVTLYAQWTADPTFSVSYMGNGNTGGNAPVDGNNYLSGASVAVLGNTGGLVKSGNTFVGWNTQADGGGTAYASSVSFTMGSASVTLYAQWTALPTYTVTYDGNVSTGGAAPADANNYLQGQTVTARGAGTLVKAGYTFTGWNTKADGTGAGHVAGATFAMDAANVVLYAQWTVIPTYTVTYNGNANNTGTVPVDNNHYTFGQSVTVLANTGNLAKTGATFVGWNTQANGGGTGYAAAVSFVMGSGNVTLYAQWSANPTYTVTYRGNTNSGGAVPVDGNNYLSGATVTVLGNTGGLVKTGNTFVGWNTQADGGGTTYASQATFVMGSAGITLYARWTALPTYTVIYNGGSGSTGTAPVDNNSYLQGQTVTTRGAGTLAKAGYTFTGWNTQANGSGTGYAAGVTFTMGGANDTLRAQWALIPTYAVSYNGHTNTSGAAPADNNRYTVGQSVIVLGNIGNLAKPGYTFVGWNTQANDSGIGYATGVSFFMGSSNVTLYAQWTQLPTYTVTYNGNTNTSGNIPLDGNNYKSGDSVIVLGSNTLVKTGYTFVGWNTQANDSGIGYASGVKFAMGTAGVTLYAQWSANQTYKVTYDGGNGSTGGFPPTDANNYLPGATVVVLANTGTFVKSGYIFAGWDTNAAGAGVVYAPGASFIMGIANVTLHAQWIGIPTYTVTYNGNGNNAGTAPADNNRYASGQSVIALGYGSLVDSGHTFVGWNTKSNGTGIVYATGVSFFMGSSNVTLYAQWTQLPTYTVTYNGNTNTSGNIPLDGNNYKSGDSVIVLGSNTLVKTGYTFVGWNTQANDSGIGYASGVKFAMGTAGVTLYAQWSANQTYKVTYDGGNGSTGGFPPTDANNYLPGATVVVLANTGAFVKSGYMFAGWDTNAAGAGVVYAPGASFIMGITNVTLHAQWTVIPKYMVIYNKTTASGGIVPVDTNHYTFGQSVTVLANTGNLVKTGSTFVGWNTKATGNGIGYAAGTSFLMGSVNDTLFAQWTQLPTYTVTYNGNTNSGGTAPPDGNNYKSGDSVIVLGRSTLVKTGYTFVGWNTQANDSGIGYASGVKFAMGTAGVTLYAQWSANQTYKVTYDGGNGSTGGFPPTDANNYLPGATVVVLANTGAFVKSGYIFAGWDTNAAGAGVVYAPGASFIMGIANVTLHAQWTIISTYTVTYKGNTNTSGNVPVDGKPYKSGDTVTVLGNTSPLGPLVKTGNAFVGWNTQANDSGIGYASGVKFVMGSAGVTLFAQWSANPTYTVTYNGNTNSGGNVPVDPNNYLSGATVNVLDNTSPLGSLVKTGYNFAGWNTKADGTGTPYAPLGTFAMGSAGVTLYAHWTAKTTYTVTYLGNDSTGGNVPVDGNSYLTGATVTVRNKGTLVRTGCAFAGWNTQTDGNGTLFAPGDTFPMGTGNVTLYAEWVVTITATAGANGSISPSGAATVIAGTNKTYTITPAANYHIVSVTDNGSSVGAVTSYTVNNVTANHTITATFAITTYTITAATPVNGSISPSGVSTVNSGTDTTFTITADPNYHIVNVVVDNVPQGAISSFPFTNVTGNHTISATFAITTYTITAGATVNGSISPSGVSTVNSGTDTTFTITADPNYHIVNVVVDNVPQGAISSFPFTNVTGNHTITATFAITTYTITATLTGNGSISPSGAVIVESGTDTTFTITPDLNNHISAVVVDNVAQAINPTFTFPAVSANHTIAVQIDPD